MARSFETTFDVDAPPAQVWFVSTDVEAMPSWTTSITAVVLEPKGPLAVGSTARITQPKLSTATWTVTEVVPGESWTWETRASGARTIATHSVAPREGGSTVTLSVRMEGATAAAVWLVAGGLVRSYVTAEAHGLKTECERRAR
ncbi:MAG TPA: SRPBCC family protein [Candidatus Nanopelagicales bacterium]|nr:SRPBCC family protein [Candidatus Nanopelagicales bacterium]